MCMASVCLYTSEHRLGDLLSDLGQGISERQMHRYITSRTFLIGFRSGEREGQSKVAGGHFVGLWQCSSCSSLHKQTDACPAAGLMPFHGPSRCLLHALETGVTVKIIVTASMDVPSWRSLTVQPDWAAGSASCFQ